MCGFFFNSINKHPENKKEKKCRVFKTEHPCKWGQERNGNFKLSKTKKGKGFYSVCFVSDAELHIVKSILFILERFVF